MSVYRLQIYIKYLNNKQSGAIFFRFHVSVLWFCNYL